jgi:hypothetical protein
MSMVMISCDMYNFRGNELVRNLVHVLCEYRNIN